MADIKQALYEYLGAQSSLTSLVSTRIYPMLAPQGAALPYLVFQQISTGHVRSMAARAQLVRTRVQFDAYAASSTSAQAVADALRLLLDMYAGSMGGTAQVTTQRAFLDTVSDGLVAPADASEQGPFRMTLDFEIWHAES